MSISSFATTSIYLFDSNCFIIPVFSKFILVRYGTWKNCRKCFPGIRVDRSVENYD